MNRRKFALIVVAFVFVLMVASPALMSESGHPFDNQVGIEESFDDFALLADGESWLSGWGYRQSHTITLSSGAGTNYQMMFHVEYNVASSSGNIVDCNSHCQTNFDDIRFTDNDGVTQLDYWIEEKTDSDDATFWVEVADDLGSNVVIYVYYGTTGTTTTSSSGTNTFIFFDDFENNNFNRWTLAEDNWAINSVVEKYGDYCAFGDADASGRTLSKTLASALSTNFMLHSWVRFPSTVGNEYVMHGYETGATDIYAMTSLANDWATYGGSWVYYEENTQAANIWYRAEVGFDFSNSLFKFWLNRVAKTSQTLNAGDGTPVVDVLKIASVTHWTAGIDQYIDDWYVRKWQTSEPAHSTWGSEETDSEVDGDDWLTGWDYRQSHIISGAAGAGVNYQIKILVEPGSGSSSGDTIYCESHAQEDFDDIRFTDNDGVTQLDYWIEKISMGVGTFWIEVADDLSTAQTIYVYYGNTGVSTTGSGASTFLFYEDWASQSWDAARWSDLSHGTGGSTTYSVTDANHGYVAKIEGGASNGGIGKYSTLSMSAPFSFMGRVFIELTGAAYQRIYVSAGSTNLVPFATWYSREGAELFNAADDDDNRLETAVAQGYYESWQTFQISRTNTYSRLWFNHAVVYSLDNTPDTVERTVAYLYVRDTECDMYADWVAVRRFIATEPAHSTWGSEEYYNSAPVNDATPTCTNIDDTDNLYARYRHYEFDVSVTDGNGYEDIDYVELRSYDYGTTTLRWTIRYDEDDDEFSEQGTPEQKSYIQLVGSTRSKSGVNLDITFMLFIEWVHPDATDDDLYQYVIDSASASDGDSYEDTDYNYETRLDFSVLSLNDGSGTVNRGNFDSLDTITASGTIIYYGSGNNYAPSALLDAWVSCADVAGSPWYDLTWGSGAFSMTVDSDDVVGLDTYSFKVVLEGAGSGGTDQCHASHSDTYIADQIVIQTTVSSDAQDRLNINGNVEIRVTASLAYTTGGTVWLGSGDTVTLDGVSMSWDAGNSWFDLSRSKSSVGMWDFYVNSSSETGHGVTGLDLNGKNVEVIWDRVEIYSIVVADDHIGAGTGITLTCLLRYDYLGQAGVTGTFYTDTTNNQLFYQSGNEWDATINEAVGQYLFDGFTSCSESQYGLTAWTFTGSQETIVFDTVRALAIEVSDDRCNYGSNQWVRVRFDYQSAQYGYVASWSTYPTITGPNGAITLSTDDGSGWWRGSTGAYSAVDIHNYNTNTLNNYVDADSILSRSKGTYTEYTIWDRVEIYSITVSDSHLGIGYGTTLSYYLRYDYDNLAVNSGGTFTTDETADNLVYQSGFLWQATANEAGVGSIIFNGFTGCSDSGYSLTEWTFTGSQVTVTWDRVRALAIQRSDDRCDLGSNQWVQVQFDYESAGYGYVASWSTYPTITGPNGAITLSTDDGSGWWRGSTGTYSSVARFDYNTNTLNDFIDADNVLARTKGSFTDYTIWDRILIITTISDDAQDRVNINDNVEIRVTAYLEYTTGGTHWLGSGDTFYLDDTAMSWDAGNSWFELGSRTHATVGLWSYYVNSSSANEATYGITVVNLNSQDVEVIWDRVRVVSYTIVTPSGDNHNNIGTTYTIDIELHYDYDEADVADGTITVNGESMDSYQGSGKWRWTPYQAGVIGITYNNMQATGNTHGITVEDNTVTQLIIWNRIKILATGATSNYIEYGSESTTVNVTAELEYGSHTLGNGDTLYLNDTLMTWDTDHFYIVFGPYSVFGSWLLFVNSSSANEATYGITVVWLNGQNDTVATDRVKVISYAVSDARDNVNNYIWVNVTVQYESDSSAVTDGTVVISEYSFSHLGSGIWRHNRTQASAVGITFNSVVASGNVRGITVVNQNEQSQLVVWDRIKITVTWILDIRCDYGSTQYVYVTATLDYDEFEVGAGATMNLNSSAMTWDTGNSRWYKSYSYSQIINYTFYVSSAEDASHGITLLYNVTYVSITWDRVQVQSYSVSDARDNINDNVDIDITLWFDYDDTQVTDGTVTINGYSAAYQGSGVWRITRTSATAISVTYNNVQCSDNEHEITVVDQNGQSQEVIWDTIEVYQAYTYGGWGDRIDWDGSGTPRFRLRLAYDSHLLDDGSNDNVYINGTLAERILSYWKYTFPTWDTWASRDFVVTSAYEDTYGITALNVTSAAENYFNIVWDAYYIYDCGGDTVGDVGTPFIIWWKFRSLVDGLEPDSADDEDWLVYLDNYHDAYYNHTTGRCEYEMDENWINWVWEYNLTPTHVYNNDYQTEALGRGYGYYDEESGDANNSVIVRGDAVLFYMWLDDAFVESGGDTTLWVNGSYAWSGDDFTDAGSGAIYINGSSMTYHTDCMWYYNITEAVSGTYMYYISDFTDGILNLNVTGEVAAVIQSSHDAVMVSPDYTINVEDSSHTISFWTFIVNWDYDNKFGIFGNSSYGCYITNDGNMSIIYSGGSFEFDASFSTGNLYFVSIILTDTESLLYVDGILIDTQGAVGSTVDINGLFGGTSRTATGFLDDFRLYNAQLTGTELLGLYYGYNNVTNLIFHFTWDGVDYEAMTWDDNTGDYSGTIEANDYDIGIHVVLNTTMRYSKTWFDVIIVMGYSTNSTDNRDNINDYFNVSVWLQYDSGGNVTFGLIYMNGYATSYVGNGNWSYIIVASSVGNITFNSVSVGGIIDFGVDQNGKSVNIIWDRILILTTAATDGRIDYGTSGTINVTAELEYDHTPLGDGDTLYLNDTLMTWDTDHFYISVGPYSIIDLINYFVNISNANENTYGITVLNLDGNSASVIWDRIFVTLVDADGTFLSVDTQVNFTVSLEYEFDSDSITAGSFSLRYGSTYLTLTHDVSGNWTVSDISSTPASRTYDYINGTATLHGITVINMNGKTDTVSWDRIALTVWINYHWQVVVYNVTIWYTGTFEGEGWTWNGTATFNSTAGVYPIESIVANYTYVVQSITDPDYGLTAFTADNVWCIFDDIEIVNGPDYYWTQYGAEAVWLIWGAPTTYRWYFNDTVWLSQGSIIQSYMNGTADALAAIYSATGDLGGLSIGPFDPSWYYVNLTINAEFDSSDSRSFDFLIWEQVLLVEIVHSIHIYDSGFEVSDTWITFAFHTYWGNATFTIWMNDTIVGYSPSEGWYQIIKPTTEAFYNYTVLVNATHSGADSTGQTKDFSVSDFWVWLNYKYTKLAAEVGTAEIRFAFFDSADNWVPFETINCNLTQNAVTYVLTAPTATVSTANNITLEVFNKWGILISNTTFDYTQFKAITLGLYELIVDNEADHLVRLDISYNGTYPNITIMLPRNWPRFLYLASANYTLVFTYYAPATEGTIVDYNELTGYYVTYEYELLEAGYLKYTGISMADVQANIDFTRLSTNNNIDAVDVNVLAIPYPPPVPQNIVTPTMFWAAVLVFAVAAVLFAVGGHGIKGWQIAKKTKVFFQKPEDKSNKESYRDEGMPQ